MTTIKKFEDIKAWQMARSLIKEVYSLSDKKSFASDFGLRDQMQRSAVSIAANIAEGFERYGNKEFTQFLNMARGSAGELRSHFYIAFDLGYLTEKEFTDFKNKAENISRCIWNFMKYLKK